MLLCNCRSCWFPGKLKSKKTDPYLITQLLPHGEVEFKANEGEQFKVNKRRMKPYFGHAESANIGIKACYLDEG